MWTWPLWRWPHWVQFRVSHRRHGHYPKHSDELRSGLSPEDFCSLSKRPGVFETCLRRVRTENQMTKRRRVRVMLSLVNEG